MILCNVRSTTAPYTESRLTRSVANERVGFPVVEQQCRMENKIFYFIFFIFILDWRGRQENSAPSLWRSGEAFLFLTQVLGWSCLCFVPVSGFWLLMVTPCSCCVEAVLAGLMDVVCVLWSSRDAEIQAQENIRVQLELQAAKTSLLLFKVGGLQSQPVSRMCRIPFILFYW